MISFPVLPGVVINSFLLILNSDDCHLQKRKQNIGLGRIVCNGKRVASEIIRLLRRG
jgi:hypothetical protein